MTDWRDDDAEARFEALMNEATLAVHCASTVQDARRLFRLLRDWGQEFETLQWMAWDRAVDILED